MNLRNLRNLRIKGIRSFRRVELPYAVETWERRPSVVIGTLSEIAVAVGYVLMGIGLGWLLGVLHRGGVTP